MLPHPVGHKECGPKQQTPGLIRRIQILSYQIETLNIPYMVILCDEVDINVQSSLPCVDGGGH